MGPTHGQFATIRRVVTRHDENGHAVVWMDGPAANASDTEGQRRSTLLWSSGELPAPFLDDVDGGAAELGTNPPPGGTRFAIIEYLPGASYQAFHRTDTIDYVICISGEITMDLDQGSVKLSSGDVLIQLGTNHGWRNEGNTSALVGFVLIDGAPKNSADLPPARHP